MNFRYVATQSRCQQQGEGQSSLTPSLHTPHSPLGQQQQQQQPQQQPHQKVQQHKQHNQPQQLQQHANGVLPVHGSLSLEDLANQHVDGKGSSPCYISQVGQAIHCLSSPHVRPGNIIFTGMCMSTSHYEYFTGMYIKTSQACV